MRNVSTSATTTRIGSSFQNVDRRRLPPGSCARRGSLLAVGRGGALVGRLTCPAAVAPGEACGASSASSTTGSAALAKPVGTVGSSTGSGGPEPSQAVPSSAGWAPVHVCGRAPARGGGTSLWMRRAVPSAGGNGCLPLCCGRLTASTGGNGWRPLCCGRAAGGASTGGNGCLPLCCDPPQASGGGPSGTAKRAMSRPLVGMGRSPWPLRGRAWPLAGGCAGTVPSSIHGVEFREIVEARDVGRHRRHVAEIHAGRPEDFTNVGERLARFALMPPVTSRLVTGSRPR